MNRLLYTTGIYCYAFLLKAAAIFHPKARQFVNGRKQLFLNLKKAFEKNKAPVAWFHCASLGEFEQGRPLIEAFKKEYPGYKILLTFFSPSGYEIRKNYPQADWVFYLPLDTPNNAKQFISLSNPEVAFIIKYEFWNNILKYAHRKKIPVLSVSSIFRKDHPFFKFYGKLFRHSLNYFDHFFVQDEKSAALLNSIGLKNSSTSGDTRFDRVKGIREKVKSIPIAETFSKDSKVFIIGSCWPADMEVLNTFINDRKDLKFIIAPHNIDRKFIQRMDHDLMRDSICFSEAKEKGAGEKEVLIIDNVGMLSSLYQYGDYAYIGGAFGQGLHNILEPATFGLPVFFGNKNFKKFREANDLINLGGAFSVKSYSNFRKHFEKVEEAETYQMIKEINAGYVKNNSGATEIIITYCKEKLKL